MIKNKFLLFFLCTSFAFCSDYEYEIFAKNSAEVNTNLILTLQACLEDKNSNQTYDINSKYLYFLNEKVAYKMSNIKDNKYKVKMQKSKNEKVNQVLNCIKKNFFKFAACDIVVK